VLSPEQLAAVADLWTRSSRELVVRLTGRSMEPAIPSGAEVRIRCGESGGVGDVVVCREGAGVRVHRVVARAAQAWILTRGDARWLPDAPLPGDDAVLGRVTAVVRDGTFVAPPAARPSLGRRVVLWPLVWALRAHPGAGGAVLRALVYGRRLALRAVTPLRRGSARAERAGRASQAATSAAIAR
jgi:hypothetical protein